MTIGELIKKHRKEMKMTQAQLANESDISLMSVRRYESGERTPTINQIHNLALALKVFPGELVPDGVLSISKNQIQQNEPDNQDHNRYNGEIRFKTNNNSGIWLKVLEKTERFSALNDLIKEEVDETKREAYIKEAAEITIFLNDQFPKMKKNLDDVSKAIREIIKPNGDSDE